MRFSRTLLLAAAVAILASVALPAHAASVLLHKKTSIAASATQADSVLWTLTTSASGALPARDTLALKAGAINTENFSSSALIDSLSDRGALSAGHGFPHNLWVTVEVTGALQSIDTLTCYVQYSFGQVPGNAGATNIFASDPTFADPYSNPANYRWYDAIGNQAAMTGGVIALVNQTGSKTFVFPIPCAASDINTWLASSNLRVVVMSDNNAAAVGLSTRAWLTWRTQ